MSSSTTKATLLFGALTSESVDRAILVKSSHSSTTNHSLVKLVRARRATMARQVQNKFDRRQAPESRERACSMSQKLRWYSNCMSSERHAIRFQYWRQEKQCDNIHNQCEDANCNNLNGIPMDKVLVHGCNSDCTRILVNRLCP